MQDNVVVDALQVRTVSPVLSVGTETQTVTVTAAPPVLDTADATIGMTVENSTYSNLPIQMNGAQRDPTAFGSPDAGSAERQITAAACPSLAERETISASSISTACRPKP